MVKGFPQDYMVELVLNTRSLDPKTSVLIVYNVASSERYQYRKSLLGPKDYANNGTKTKIDFPLYLVQTKVAVSSCLIHFYK